MAAVQAVLGHGLGVRVMLGVRVDFATSLSLSIYIYFYYIGQTNAGNRRSETIFNVRASSFQSTCRGSSLPVDSSWQPVTFHRYWICDTFQFGNSNSFCSPLLCSSSPRPSLFELSTAKAVQSNCTSSIQSFAFRRRCRNGRPCQELRSSAARSWCCPTEFESMAFFWGTISPRLPAFPVQRSLRERDMRRKPAPRGVPETLRGKDGARCRGSPGELECKGRGCFVQVQGVVLQSTLKGIILDMFGGESFFHQIAIGGVFLLTDSGG